MTERLLTHALQADAGHDASVLFMVGVILAGAADCNRSATKAALYALAEKGGIIRLSVGSAIAKEMQDKIGGFPC